VNAKIKASSPRAKRIAELERENARLESHANALDEKLTTILTDPKYEGGVQYWIQKHDALMHDAARIAQLRELVTQPHEEKRSFINRVNAVLNSK
jgi:hypothetical protein